MTVSTRIKQGLNAVLAGVNLKLDSLTIERREAARIAALESRGMLGSRRYGELPAQDETLLPALAARLKENGDQLARLESAGGDVGYEHDNGFFSSPDMQALYLLLRELAPSTIVEVGSGNSTRISRQAIIDGGLGTRIVSIDPMPRVEIAGFADEFIRSRLEDMDEADIAARLEPGDILFIDSSHEVRTASDVVMAICNLLPLLKAGVIVHFHDIFLPFEYPADIAREFSSWGEQYLLYAYLQARDCELLWPGCLLQRERPALQQQLPFLARGRAQSFWFRLR